MKRSNYSIDIIELKKIMIEKGYDTTIKLAQEAKIDRNTLSKVLKGTSRPSSDVMYKLAECLEISPTRAGEIFFKLNLRIE